MPKPSKEVYMELLKLKPRKVKLNQLYLDPNNPRFGTVQTIPDDRAFEDSIQQNAQQKIEVIGIDDLIQKISRYGFVSTDVVVARKCKNDFVVIEGNRRLAALRKLMQGHTDGEKILPSRIMNSMEELNILLYEGKDPDIAWVIQGLRHMEGIKEWPPLQQAAFIAKLEKRIKKRKLKDGETHIALVGRVAGIKGTARAAGLLNSHYAFRQAKKDEDYGDNLKPDRFALFNEAIFKKEVLQEWLKWDDKSRSFQHKDNLKRLLSWISPSEEGGEPRISKLEDVRDVVPELIGDGELLRRFEDGALDINQVRVELAKRHKPENEPNLESLRDQLNQFLNLLDTLPVPKVRREHQSNAFSQLLAKLKESIEVQIKNLGS
jgi:hypothetical protein